MQKKHTFTNTLIYYVDKTVPARLKETDNINTHIRARVMAALLLSNFFLIALVLLFLIVAANFVQNDLMEGFIMISIALVVLSFELFLFYRFANIAISGMIFSMVFFTFTLVSVIISGGWESPVIMLFFSAPAISFLVGGRQEGFYMTTLVCGCGVAFMLASQNNLQIFQVIEEENIELVRVVMWVISVILLAICLTVYDTILEYFSTESQGKPIHRRAKEED